VERVIQQLCIWALPVLAAVILHEIAHGFVAYRLGDPTAARLGRLTLNPLPHIDPIGTVVLPLLLVLSHAPFLFGYARPVPVNFANLRNPKRDMMLVAAAGPLTNLLLAVVNAALLKLLLHVPIPAEGPFAGLLIGVLKPVALMAQASVYINVGLAIFNLLPILPLDGGRVLAGLLPRAQAIAFSRLEPFGFVIVVVLIATKVLDSVIGPVIGLFLHALLS
jgi:Zn-dependent protease